MLRSTLLLLGAALCLALQPASASTCTELTTPRLCGSNDYVVPRTECNSSVIDFPEMAPCCRLHTEQARKCDDPAATQKCRSVEIMPSICPGESEMNCCFRKEISMRLHFAFETSNKTCCSTCRCYGDPHCESFNGDADTWVICDARSPKPTNIAQCPMSQATCLAQLDHTGMPCSWTNTPSQKDWSIALMGSPCRHNQSASITPPQMSMYKTDNFDIILNMGERSIIETLIIKDGANTYALGAQDCFDYAYSNRNGSAWKDNWGHHGKTPEAADWLPKKWVWSPVDGQDMLWEIGGLESKIDLSVRCTRTPERVANKIRYGPPRLNVEIIEPLDWHDIDKRPNSGGFCIKGKIDKQGSTANTDDITARGACTSETDNLALAQMFCGEGVTTPGVPACMLSWCKNHVREGGDIDLALACQNDIQSFSWAEVFCALNVFGARTCENDPLCMRTAKDCKGNLACRACLAVIQDDGWSAAITRYDNPWLNPSDEECLEVLPPRLIFQQKGVQIQYLEPFTQTWITRYAIPSTACLKDGYVTLNKNKDPELFYNPIRIIQCSPLDGLVGKCSQEIGFKSRIEVIVAENEVEKVWNAYESGDLICNPAIYPNKPYDCLENPPPVLCPCPA